MSCFIRIISFVFLFAFVLPYSIAFQATVCDCGSAENKGFLKFSNEDCDHQIPQGPAPVPVIYSIYSTIPAVTRFPGFMCTMWIVTKTAKMDFWGYTYEDNTRMPLEVSASDCRTMRDTRQCNGKPMDVLGDNKWSIEGAPHVQASWWWTRQESLVNCRLEEVSLETEAANSTISSPIGDIPAGTDGSISHNLVTLVWDNSYKELQKCTVRKVEEGVALKHTTSEPFTNRIRDSQRQTDFLFSTNSTAFCDTPAKSSDLKPVLGMENVMLHIREIDSATYAMKMENDDHEAEKMALMLKAEVDSAAHSQFMRDITVEMSNRLAREIRAIQFQTRELAHKNAVATAQYNGWLAASYLELPLCSKLVPIGNSVAVLQCSPMNVTFTTEITSCGPQPRYNDSTISIEGWELTHYSECYWHSFFVNFNGHAHTYRNNTWTPVIPSIIVQGHQLIDTLPFEADNAFGTVLRLHPALRSNPMSPAMTIAGILATVQAHNAANHNGDSRISNVLLPYDAVQHLPFLSRVGIWFRNFGILAGVGIVALLAFRFCGIWSLLIKFIPCLSFLKFCSPYSWLDKSSSSPSVQAEPTREFAPQSSTTPTCRIEMVPVAPPVSNESRYVIAAASNERRVPYTTINVARNNHREAARLLK